MRKLLWLIWLVCAGCIVPADLSEEEEAANTPPRFLRNECDPVFLTTAVIDSGDKLKLTMVVEDLDTADYIPFRIYRDYALAPDTQIQKQMTIVASESIPPTSLDSGSTIRSFEFNLSQYLLCSSDEGDVSGSQHIIDVVIANGFSNSWSEYPFARSTLGPSDVWSFVVICVQSQKSGGGTR